MGLLKRFQEGRRAALAEYGIGVDRAPQPWPDDPTPRPEWHDDPAPLPPDPREGGDTDAATRVAELEAQLAGLQDELNAMRETHEKDDKLIAELRKMNEQYEAHTAELEALEVAALVERDQLIEVLKLPGMKRLLEKTYFPDKHPEATANEKRAFDDYSKTINVAYDLIKQDDRAKKSDEAA